MTGDREEMAERIRAGLDPQPKCPYRHDARARCPNCAEWPRRDEKVVAEVAQLAQELDVATAAVVRSSLNLRRLGLIAEVERDETGLTMRAKLLPGVLIDDEPLGVHVAASVWRIVGRWALGFGMVAAGAAVMYAEGQRQPQPGVGFAIGLTLIVGAALLVARGRDDG